jgi:hypothetical protein
MNKRELTERLAKEAHKSRAKAADDVDSLVYGLLRDLRLSSKLAGKEPVAVPKPPSSKTAAPKPKKEGA